MTTSTTRITLAHHFSQPVLAPLIQMKGLLSKKPYLNLLSVLHAGLAVFEQAAVLGRARNIQMETLAKLFSTPGNEEVRAITLLKLPKKISKVMAKYPKASLISSRRQ